MKTMIRPLRSWLALIARIEPALPDADRPFVQTMREKLTEGWGLTPSEADRLERLDSLYRAAQ